MAAITGTLCGFTPPEGGKACARRVKSGEIRCWQHQGQQAAGEKKPILDIETIERQRHLLETLGEIASPHNIILGNADNFRTSMIKEFTPIASDAIVAVYAATEKMDVDITVPEQARKSLFEKGLDHFVNLLVDEGMDKNRISKMRVSGFNRMTVGGAKQHADEAFHEVVILDADTPNEVVIDPYMAMFAPVKDQSRSVDEQLPNGATPFGDLPWIGTVRSYVGGDYLWWNNFRMERVTR